MISGKEENIATLKYAFIQFLYFAHSASAMSALAKIFHLVAVAHFYFGAYYDITYVTEPDAKHRGFGYAGRYIYLTILSFIFHGCYFTLALLNDFIGSNKATTGDRPLIRKIRDYLFGTLSFPLAFNVGGMFWLLMTIDRELVMPKSVDAFFPSWLNHFMHTNIMIFMILEMIFLHHKYPCRKSALIGLSVIMLAYLGWVHVIWFETGRWVYPVLAVLNWPQRIGFYLFTNSVPVACYFLGEFLNKIIWSSKRIGEAPKKPQSKKSKSK